MSVARVIGPHIRRLRHHREGSIERGSFSDFYICRLNA